MKAKPFQDAEIDVSRRRRSYFFFFFWLSEIWLKDV